MLIQHKYSLMQFAAVAMPLVLCCGCGGRPIPISGMVTLDGKPIEKGTISLEPFDQRGPTLGGAIVAGQYRLDGDAAPLPGKKIVRIFGTRKTGKIVQAGIPFPKGTMVEEIKPCVPKKFNEQSTLTCEVVAGGPTQFDFSLKTP